MTHAATLLLGILVAGLAPPPGDLPVVPIEAGMVITESVRIKAGVYRIADHDGAGAVRIRGDGITVDFAGAELVGAAAGTDPDHFSGFGIRIEGGADVTLLGATVRGFKVGIWANDSPGVTIRGCDVSRNYRQRLRSTPEREDLSDWLYGHRNDSNQWLRYGAGIYLFRCQRATLAGNRGHQGQNGICMSRCDDGAVYDNDMSFNSGWGLALWRSSRNVVSHNKLDYCMRGFSYGVYHRGQDSTGILVYEQCNANVFAFNSATHGGDGFFMYAGHETVQRTGRGGCNDNILYRNDFSHAAANGIEATFSRGNVFWENRLDDCDYGVWAGYSYETVIVGNTIRGCNNGISIEHGRDNRIDGNLIEDNRRGVHLWWDDDEDLLASAFGRAQPCRSERSEILRNVFRRNGVAIRLAETSSVRVAENLFEANPVLLEIRGRSPGVSLMRNNIDSGEIRAVTEGEPFTPGPNHWTTEAQGPSLEAPVVIGKPRIEIDPPEVPGSLDALLPEGTRRGRRWIFVDQWGPFDFSEVRVMGPAKAAWSQAKVFVVGPPTRFSVTDLRGDVELSAQHGTLPETLTVSAGKRDVTRFSFTLRPEGFDPIEVSGVILSARWDVRFFAWERDPRHDDESWKQLLAGEPLVRRSLDRLDFTWGADGPGEGERMRRDRFASLATTELSLPAGTWELRTVSDDGVRVWLDGKRVIDSWTVHAPSEDRVQVVLAAGHHRLRVEHFENDGHAQLQLWLRPLEVECWEIPRGEPW